MTEEEKEQIVEELHKECATTASIATKLAQDAKQYTKEVPVPDEYQWHWKVFSEEESHRFPPSRIWDHMIDLKEGAPPKINCKLIPMTPAEDEALRVFLKEQTDKGYIRESKSPYASTFFFIKKKDGKLCPIQDYRKLNEQTIRNRYPLPLIPDLIAEVQNAWIFTKFDIRWGLLCPCRDTRLDMSARYLWVQRGDQWFRGGLNDQVWTEDERNPVDLQDKGEDKAKV